MTLSDFLAWLLATKDIAQPEVACHKLSEDAEGNPQVESVESCSFEPLKTPARSKLTPLAAASMLAWPKINWTEGKREGGHILIIPSWKFEDAQQMKMLTPAPPTIFLRENRKIYKGKCFRLSAKI